MSERLREAFEADRLPPLPPELRDRVLTSRVAGARVILPLGDPGVVPDARREWSWRGVAVAAAVTMMVVLAEGVWSPSQEADAGSTGGAMTFAPALARPGALVQVDYVPSASLASSTQLALRARLRSASHPSYQTGIPVRTVAVLTRDGDGHFRASFALPDSVVYAAFVAEDSSRNLIDDHQRRTWELLTTLDGVRPSLTALDQRANDLMGRNFEEGHATVRRMTVLYPDSLSAWSFLSSFDFWLGIRDRDTVLIKHRAALAHADSQWRRTPKVPAPMLGRLAWYAQGVDSAAAVYWRARLLREAPTASVALQFRLSDASRALWRSRDTSAMLRMLDSLWSQRTPDRAQQIADAGVSYAVATARAPLVATWWGRLQRVSADSIMTAIDYAKRVSRVPSLVAQGIGALRAVLHTLEQPTVTARHLTEAPSQREDRHARRRRYVLSALGQALVSSGELRAGRDTLILAAERGWDVENIRALRHAHLALGDSAAAWTQLALESVDPTLSGARRDSINATAAAGIDAERWRGLVRSASETFASRVLADAVVLSLGRTARVRDSSGRESLLRERTASRTTVVVFWSRDCGWALDDVAKLNAVADRLRAVGSQLLIVSDDAQGMTPELRAFLARHRVTTPVYFDVDHTTAKAFNNWGTPYYYVVDTDSRLRFAAGTDLETAHVRAEAVRLSGAR